MVDDSANMPDLQRIIFERATKEYKVDWAKLERKNLDLRADQILEEVNKLHDQYPSCYLDLYSSLRIITIAGTTRSICRHTERMVNVEPASKYFYGDMFKLERAGNDISKPVNRAAWFCAMQDKVGPEWVKIYDLAVRELQRNTAWTPFSIEPPTKVETAEIDEGIVQLEAKFSAVMAEKKHMDFPVRVHSLPSTAKYVRYAITIPKDPFKTYLCEKGDVKVGVDPTMHTFYLDHFFAENYIRVSWPVMCEEREFADLFVECVLGSKVAEEPVRYYTKPLRTFTSSKASEAAMELTEADKESIQSIFISSVDFTYAETEEEAERIRRQRENKKRKKAGEELRPAFKCYNYTGPHIWSYLDQHFDPKRYKPEWRDVLSITFTVRLRKLYVHGSYRAYDANATKDFKIICRPDRMRFSPPMHEIVEPEYKATLRYVAEQKLKLKGELLGEHVATEHKDGTDGSAL